MQKRHPLAPAGVISWRENEYQKAKTAIEPFGEGLGREFIRHFLPKEAISNNDTLQGAITAYYQEFWKQEGDALLEQSGLLLWQGMNSDPPDPEKIAQAHELEMQALVFLGKLKVGGVTRALLCSLSNNEKASDSEAAGKKGRVPHNMETTMVAGTPGCKGKQLLPMARL